MLKLFAYQIVAIMTLVSVFLVLVVAPLPAVAEEAPVDPFSTICEQQPNSSVCQGNTVQQPGDNVLVGPNGTITKIVKTLVYISGVGAVVMIIIAGLRYSTSGGNPEYIAAAKNTALYAIVGLGFAMSAWAIVTFVLNKL